jgi:hypothetical protein
MRINIKQTITTFILIILVFACTHDGALLNPLFTSRINDTVAKTPFDSTTTTSGCDTTKINYVEHIKPIMTKYCTSCHSTNLKLGGYDLSTYAGTLIPAKSGKLLGSVLHGTGFIPMPSTNQFISTCEVSLIKRWIEQAYLVDSVGSSDTAIIVNPPVTPSVNTCNPDTVYFASQILPLMVSSCAMSGCHDVISKKDGVIMTDYTNIMKIVKANDPNGSKLYKSLIDTDLEDRMPMSPIPPLNQTQIALVYKWIEQGAKNNACTNTTSGTCTTTNMSFSKDVLPIFTSNCNGCHNAVAPSAGINLTTYSGTISISTRIIGSITHAAGFSPMPTSTIKLSDCDISKISAWINQGKLNN